MNPYGERQQRPDEIARSPGNSAAVAIVADLPEPPLAAATRPPQPQRVDADEALRGAIVAALQAGDLARVKALVGILESSPRASVINMPSRRTLR